MGDIRKILVPIDFSTHAASALDYAIELAKVFGAEVHLLHCYQANPIGIAAYEVLSPVDFERDMREAAREQLCEWRDKVAAEGLEAHEHLTPHFPSEAIADLEQEISADLIVMGTQGRSGLSHLLLGSVAERTLRNAACPVLTVHAPRVDSNARREK